jgi:hypothetical protein
VTKDAVRAYAVAFMPRYALLRRMLALPDERQHLSDPHWLERLLQHGIFENDVPGRSALAVTKERSLESLKLVESTAFRSGVVLLRYAPDRTAG